MSCRKNTAAKYRKAKGSSKRGSSYALLLALFYTHCSTNSAKPCAHMPYGVCLKEMISLIFSCVVLFLSIIVDL